MALGLRGAMGAAALAKSLMARYRLAGTWPADAELQVLTPAVPGAPPAPTRTERARAEEPAPPLHIRLSADIRLIRRLLADRAAPSEARRERRPGRTTAVRTEVRLVDTVARPERVASGRGDPAERARPGRRVRPATLPGPAVIRMPAPASNGAMSPVTILRPIHTHATTETRALLVIRSLAPAEPSAGAPVMAVRTPSRAETTGRDTERSQRRAAPPAQRDAVIGRTPDTTRAALPGRPASAPIPLEIARREASAPQTPGAEAALEHPAQTKPLASRTRAAAARLAAERAPKLAVRSRRGPGPSLDRRTLAGRPTPSAPRITPIIPRAIGQPSAAGDPAAPTRVVARRVSPEAAATVLDSPTTPVIAQPAARQPGAPTLTPTSPIPSPGAPRPQARGDQRRQAVALEVRRAPVPAAPPAPAAQAAAERASEPRGQAGQRTAKTKPPQIDAPMLRKALNELPIGEFEPLADRLIAEFEWQLKRGLERSGRR
jgi:hypothetical protein